MSVRLDEPMVHPPRAPAYSTGEATLDLVLHCVGLLLG
jgi:hypothetical protein